MSQKSREGILNELTDYFLWSFEWTYEGFYSIQNNSLGFYSLKQVFTFPKNSRCTFFFCSKYLDNIFQHESVATNIYFEGKTSRNNCKEAHLSICVMLSLRSFRILKEFSPKKVYSISAFLLVLFLSIQLHTKLKPSICQKLSPSICEKQMKLMKWWFGPIYFVPFLWHRKNKVRSLCMPTYVLRDTEKIVRRSDPISTLMITQK